MTKRKIWQSNDQCCLCHMSIASRARTDWLRGNNAEPVMDGRCCDVCNESIVTPVRVLRSYAQKLHAAEVAAAAENIGDKRG